MAVHGCFRRAILASGCLLFFLSIVSDASGQSGTGELHTDPQTGIVYRKVTRTIPRAVVDETIEKRETTVFRPETVRETKPELKTVYLPVTETKWQPVVEGRWIPFVQPRVSYRQVPETRWEARTEVINRTVTQTRWVPEKRTIEVPHQTVRYENEQRVDYQPIARVMPQPRVEPGASQAVASRLQPLRTGTPLAPLSGSGGTVSSNPGMQVASNTVGAATSEQPFRSSFQMGMKKNVLLPNGAPGARMVPGTAGIGIATVPTFSMRR